MGPCGWHVPHDPHAKDMVSHVRHVNWREFCHQNNTATTSQSLKTLINKNMSTEVLIRFRGNFKFLTMTNNCSIPDFFAEGISSLIRIISYSLKNCEMCVKL